MTSEMNKHPIILHYTHAARNLYIFRCIIINFNNNAYYQPSKTKHLFLVLYSVKWDWISLPTAHMITTQQIQFPPSHIEWTWVQFLLCMRNSALIPYQKVWISLPKCSSKDEGSTAHITTAKLENLSNVGHRCNLNMPEAASWNLPNKSTL